MKVNYEESCKKALTVGYEEVEDTDAYNGISYIKDNLKWIHDIEALAEKLGVKTTEELEQLGYNCEDYYKYEGLSYSQTLKLLSREEILDVFGDGVADVQGLIYLSDGVYMTEDGDLVDTKGDK